MRGRLNKTLGAGRREAAALFLVAACAACALADGAPTITSSEHVLVGMVPRTGFEVTCDDSLISASPITSDDYGIIQFSIDEGIYAPPGTVSVRVPAPPQISGEHVTEIEDVSAAIVWTTDHAAHSQVLYGSTTSYDHATPATQTYTTSHRVVLTGLTPETVYHWCAISVDASGRAAVSPDHLFKTRQPRPLISDFFADADTTMGVVVGWRTDRPCDTQVEYGLESSYGSWSPLDTTLVSQHEVVLEDLLPFTTYHLRAWSEDATGWRIHSNDYVVTTLAPRLVLHDVAASDTSATTATICWATTNPASTQVEYGLTASYGQITEVQDRISTGHLAVLEGLQPGTPYHFRAISTDIYGQTVRSEDREFRTYGTDHPGAIVVYECGVAALDWDSATIRWVTNLPSSSIVEYGTSEEYGSVVSDSTLAVYHEVVLLGLSSETTYHFRATSVADGGSSVTTEDQTFTTLSRPLLIEELHVSALAETLFTVEWNTSRPASSVVVYGTGPEYDAATPFDPELVTHHVVTVEGLVPGTAYHYRAFSTDEDGITAGSEDRTVTTVPPELILFDVAAGEPEDTSVTIEWGTSNPATSVVEYGTTETYGMSVSDPERTTEHAIGVTGLEPATWYHFRVRSADAYGQEVASGDAVFLTAGESSSLVIENIGVADIGPTYATVSWTTNLISTSSIEYGLTEAYGSQVSSADLVRQHVLLLSGLLEDATYHYRVRSSVPGGPQTVSEDRTFSTPDIADFMPPQAPTGLAASAAPSAIALSWTANIEPDLAEYVVYRCPEGGAWSSVADVPAYETSWTDESVAPGVFYEYAIAAVDGAGNESERTDPVTAIAAPGLGGGLWAYPNPARESAHLRILSPAGASRSRGPATRTVSIYDAAGRLVTSIPVEVTDGQTATVVWDTTDSSGRKVPSGVYFCAVSFESGRQGTKLMVVR